LSQDRRLGDYFDEVLTFSGNAKSAANWVRGDLLSKLNEHELGIASLPDQPKTSWRDDPTHRSRRHLRQDCKSSFCRAVVEANRIGRAITSEKNQLEQVSDASAIEPLIDALIAENPKQAADLRAGKDKLLGFFVGKVMQATKGKANPKQVNDLIRQKLSEA